MKNRIYILTEDLNFYYRINKELKRYNLIVEILNVRNKIPDIPNSVILTTKLEIPKFGNYESLKDKVLFYSKDSEQFSEFIIKILAAHRIGLKEYSELLFSIDPGAKKYGLAVFLDDYFLISQTFYEKIDLIQRINTYIQSFSKIQVVKFKFGTGELTIAHDLINDIIEFFDTRLNLIFYLVDETKSSKTRLFNSQKKKIPKHEASAIIIALREGIEIEKQDYKKLISPRGIKITKEKQEFKNHIEDKESKEFKFISIIEDLLDDNIQLEEAIRRVKYISE